MRIAGIVVLTVVVFLHSAGFGSAQAGFRRHITPTSRIVRIEGRWASAEAGDPAAIGRLQLATAADGTAVRPFDVIQVRSYHDADGGMEIFRKACLRPAVNLRGRADALARMSALAAGEPLTLYGQFATGSAELLISSIEVPGDEE